MTMTKKLEKLRDRLCKSVPEDCGLILGTDQASAVWTGVEIGFDSACAELLPVVRDLIELIESTEYKLDWVEVETAIAEAGARAGAGAGNEISI